MFGKPFGGRADILAGVTVRIYRLCGNPGAEKGCSIGMGDAVENKEDGTGTSRLRRIEGKACCACLLSAHWRGGNLRCSPLVELLSRIDRK